MRKVFKIAEIGINHNGSLEITTDLIEKILIDQGQVHGAQQIVNKRWD